jgi:hypothetical protein
METQTFSPGDYVICHGVEPGKGVACYFPEGGELVTGAPNVEVFKDQQSALAKALELGLNLQKTRALWPDGKTPLVIEDQVRLDESGQPYFVPLDRKTRKLRRVKEWDPDKEYVPGARVLYEGKIWLHLVEGRSAPGTTPYDLKQISGEWIPVGNSPEEATTV